MLTSKQRSYLKKLANDIPDVVHIGKEGITPALIQQANDAIVARELIKGKVQKNAPFSSETAGQELAEAIKAEVVSIIGNKFILYKKEFVENKNNGAIEKHKTDQTGKEKIG